VVSDEAPAEVLYCLVGLYCVVGCVYVVVVGRELTEEAKCAGQDEAFSSCESVQCIREWEEEGEQTGKKREEVGSGQEVGRGKY
jgi:hypothetical protein